MIANALTKFEKIYPADFFFREKTLSNENVKRTVDLITKYNHFTWECNHLATFQPSSSETERENLNSRVL